MNNFARVALLLISFGISSPSFAEPLETVPEPLRPWVGWVLHDVPDHACPPQYNSAGSKHCVWAGRLELQLGNAGGTFSQTVKAYRKTWYALPGEAGMWPQNVTLDGAAAAVVPRENEPGLWLPPGEHRLSGAFVWKEMPEKMPLGDSVLIGLSIRGQAVAGPLVDESGLLWLARRAPKAEAGGAERLRVFRLVSDGVPVTLTTRLQFDASSSKEAVYGPVLPPGAIPLSLQSQLPVRIEPNGAVRVQLRPGQWQVDLVARLPGPVSELSRPKAAGTWPEEEIWSFAPQTQFRVATPSGPAAIDPQQTDVPYEWKSFPAFRMRAGDKLAFTETRRGDPQPEPDRLTLTRRIWLDFDGGGYTVSDSVNGAMSRHWRLEMDAPFVLGRAALDGRDQLITKLKPDAQAGIELRQGNLALAADSRVEDDARTLPITGWRENFQGVSAQLNLPAGWRLIAATGVDSAPGTWTSLWTLLDFFLVLVATLAVFHMWGWRWAALMLLMLALTWQEPGAPTWLWLALLAAIALVQNLPDGRLRVAARWTRHALLLVLVLISLPFAITEIRQAIYPVLEQPYLQSFGLMSYRMGEPVSMDMAEPRQAARVENYAPPAPAAPAEAPAAAAPAELQQYQALEDKAKRGRAFAGKKKEVATLNPSSVNVSILSKTSIGLDEVDPKAVVQTGPGLPSWNWHTYSLGWSGPVERTQTMTLWLASPFFNALLALLRVALIAAFALHMAGVRLKWPRLPLRGAGTAAVVLLAVLSLPHDVYAQDRDAEPDPRLLEQLKARLTAPHDCHPGCADIPRMALETGNGSLTLRLSVAAVIDTAIALPGKLGHWQPRQAMLDGRPALLVRDEDGIAWMLVNAGTHQVILEGALSDNQDIGLPMKPRLVTVRAGSYRVDGIDANGVPAEALRISRQGAHAAELKQRGQVPSFVRIERTFQLGLHWQLETRVVRISSDSAPVTIELPLLPGETLVSEAVRTSKGRVQAVLPAQANELVWHSTLTERDTIDLASAKQTGWVESWRFDSGALWHIEFEGLPPVHHQSAGRWLPEWRPWPGETLKAHITRPAGVQGQDLTLDSAALDITPGLRSTDTRLDLTLRSSRGGEHTLTLPEDAELLGATINDISQPLRLEKNTLRLPVAPGTQNVSLTWREPSGIGLLFGTPEVRLGTPGVNASVRITMPSGRWVLWVHGPRIGPAILFWGVVLALIPIAFGLARLKLVPLPARDWFLLGLGLTQSPVYISLIIVAWFFGLAMRERGADSLGNRDHNLIQVLLGLLTLATLIALIFAISTSLLGEPEMQIAGNGSSFMSLNWYQDRISDAMPGAQVLSVPLYVYRLAMLAWSLWLAIRLIGWLKWGWRCFASGGYWRRVIREKKAAG
jgi:hypothetical protein